MRFLRLLGVLTGALSLLAAEAGAPPLRVPFVRQMENGCGAASVAMVARYWGLDKHPEQVYRDLYQPEQKGILLSDMQRYLEQSGFQAYTLRGEFDDLERHSAKGRPIIVALKKNRAKRLHFAVLLGVENGRVWLNDPTRKKASRLKRESFLAQWNAAERWMLLAAPRPS